MACAAAAPPSTPSAPPSVKSFCTSITSSARAMVTSRSVVGEVVSAGEHRGGEGVERRARVAGDPLPDRVERAGERRAVARDEVARGRVGGAGAPGLGPLLAPADG